MTKDEFDKSHARFLETIREGFRLCVEKEEELNQDLKNGRITLSEWQVGIKESRQFMSIFESNLDQYIVSLKKLKID